MAVGFKITGPSTVGLENLQYRDTLHYKDVPVSDKVFTSGTADSIDLSSSIPAGYTTPLVSDGTPLPSGVSISNTSIIWSGSGVERTTRGHNIKATLQVSTASSDWETRINDPLVVWYHNFDSAAEVNAFRWTGAYGGGNDPLAVGNANAQYVQWVSSGGADGGGYMQLTRYSSAMDNNYWWRPFAPLDGQSNGRGVDDPAANGTLTVGHMVATNGGSQTLDWGLPSNPKPGWYGHSSDQNSFYDGGDFWVQLRVMVDPRRTTSGNPQVGKFTSFTNTNESYTQQELVTYSGYWGNNTPSVGSANYHNVYQGYNYAPLSDVATTSSGTRIQLGSDLGVCDPYSQVNSGCWAYAVNGTWDTLLYHVMPGRNGVSETRYQVWAAHDGETVYTKIWDVIYPAHYESGTSSSGGVNRPGWNALLCWIYQNGASMSTFWQRFDQIIFKKGNGGVNPDTDGIACPQVYA